MSRLNNSLKNITYSLIGQASNLIIAFITRMIFIKYLSTEYLGLDGLFSNILSMLSIAELGIGTAINFSLYKPLAQKNNKEICALMNLYKKIYNIIGLSIFFIGVCVIPFIPNLINGDFNSKYVNCIYLLYLINSASTYFFTYKRSLIMAAQKTYIVSLIHYMVYFIVSLLQVIIIILTKNFMLYLLIRFIFNFIENIIISVIANKMFTFLKFKANNKISNYIKEDIIKNIKAMFCHKIGGIVVLATDNILISKFVDIMSVGLYSNYLIIINSLRSVISQFFNGIIASVGNLGVTKGKDDIEEKFNIINFIGFWIFGFSTISLFLLLNPFIEIWIGKNYIFSTEIVFIIVFNFYITGMRQPVLTFRTALGLFWYDRYKPLFEASINIIVSIILAKQMGILGVFVGTTISTLTTCFWIEPYVLYKYAFKKTIRGYFDIYIKYTCIMFFALMSTKLCMQIVQFYFTNNFLIKMIICIIIPNIIFIVAFFKRKEYLYMKNLFKNIILRRLK